LLGLEGLIDGSAPGLVILALEHGRQCGFEIVDECVHAVAKFAGPSSRQLDRHGFARIIEIVDVDPIGRASPLARDSLLKNALNCALGAHAVRSDDEQVKTRLANASTKFDRVEGAGLTNKSFFRLEVGRRFE
jgi:hypothetical protein